MIVVAYVRAQRNATPSLLPPPPLDQPHTNWTRAWMYYLNGLFAIAAVFKSVTHLRLTLAHALRALSQHVATRVCRWNAIAPKLS